MKWNVTKIRQAFGAKLVGNLDMREIVCKTLLVLPSDIIATLCATVWFMSSPDDSWAFTFKGSDIKDRSLIFLSDELLRQNDEQISFTILHEVGHVILNHRNSIGYQQTETEIKQQEEEADRFANKYIKLTKMIQ
ncbi:MAG: M48 family metalloprotease [Candidatus Levyibacteriota bacterium]